ncbi:MAG TPA: hypothetical protein VFA75_12775 [Nevskia sp.]|nr:hypothetical protein [Nevskia sp.]
MPTDTRKIPIALAAFDDLPDSALVPQPVVEALWGISPSTVLRRVKNKTLPEPERFGTRCTRWRVGDLRKSMAKAA